MIATVAAFVWPLRTYKHVWRNSKDEIVKIVHYDESTRFAYILPHEYQCLRELPNGFEYDLLILNTMGGLKYRRRKTLG